MPLCLKHSRNDVGSEKQWLDLCVLYSSCYYGQSVAKLDWYLAIFELDRPQSGLWALCITYAKGFDDILLDSEQEERNSHWHAW